MSIRRSAEKNSSLMRTPASKMYVAVLFVLTCALVAIVAYTLYSNFNELTSQTRILKDNNHAMHLLLQAHGIK